MKTGRQKRGEYTKDNVKMGRKEGAEEKVTVTKGDRERENKIPMRERLGENERRGCRKNSMEETEKAVISEGKEL